ncbi:MAG: type 1 glutamine amidotransferase [Nitriliruptoraceae bacterium]
MRALFLAHDPGSQPGLVGAALERRGFELEVLAMAESIDDGTWHGHLPAADEHDLIVPLGAIWSLTDRSQVGSWIDRELALLREADAMGIPVLGICFGAQALAAAHGGRVEPSPRSQIGWSSLDSDDPSLVPPGPWMQWHTDRFVIPPGATELARDPLCSQAFVLHRNLGVQFHPEVEPAGIERWLELGGDAAVAAVEGAGSDVEQLLRDARSNTARAASEVELLVETFLTEVAGLR